MVVMNKEIDMDKERELLIKELKEWAYASNNTMISIYKVADFILKDRERIVAPLVKFQEESENRYMGLSALKGIEAVKVIKETFKLAGMEK